MLGLMQDWPLLCHRIIDHAAHNHAERPVISRSIEGPFHTTTYAESAHARVARRTTARTRRHQARRPRRDAGLEYVAAPGSLVRHYGIGAVYHTVNPRLFPDQIIWIANHAEDRVMMVDLTFVPLLEKLADRLKTIERYVVLTDAAHMPATTLKNAVAYEDWIAEVDGDFAWKVFDENTAAGMCYTSGTTGNPKGVFYSHRSNVLHSMMAAQGDGMGVPRATSSCRSCRCSTPIAGALALTSPMVGARMVMPGAKLDGASIYELLEPLQVTFSAAVPTVWLMLLQHLETSDRNCRT